MSPTHGAGMGSSPHSGNEAASSPGTPSTVPTNISPENASGAKAARFHLVTRPALQVGIETANKHVNDYDVFLNAPTPGNGRQLSPTAEVFTPGGGRIGRVQGTQGTQGVQGVVPLYATLPLTLPVRPQRPAASDVNASDVSSLLKGSTPERKAKALTPEQSRYPFHPGVIGGPRITPGVKPVGKVLRPLELADLGLDALVGTCLSDVRFREGAFSTDEASTRALIVANIPDNFRSTDLATAFKASSFPTLRSINASQLVSNGVFTVSFADVRDTRKAYEVITAMLPLARVFPMPPKRLAAEEGKDPSQVTDYEGQVVISVYHNAHTPEPSKAVFSILGEIKRLLAQCGDVKAFHSMVPIQTYVREFRAEFCNADVVETVKEVMGGAIISGAVLDVEAYKPDVREVVDLSEPQSPPEKLSITGRSTVPVDPDYDRLAIAIQREALRTGRRVTPSINHNAIDIGRIQAGIDVRTTIMLRNIPNRVDQTMLKTLLDVTSFGRYDFMYLRIDFANNCNVGYAFINFVDAQSVIPFVLARAGKRWNCFASDKVAEVSYATIQGRDCLVSKFRNSSVMLEHPGFRPKLFFAGNVPNAGQEERFPGPDNASKMRRSVENAEHVGLFVLPSVLRRTPPSPVENRLRRVGFVNGGSGRRAGGLYLPPARAHANATSPTKSIMATSEEPDNQTRGSAFTVNVDSPYDPFAGSPARFSPFRT